MPFPRRLCAAALLLAATASQAQSDELARARAAQQRGDHAAAAMAWERAAAASASEALAAEYRLAAAEAAMRAGDHTQAESLLSRLPAASMDVLQRTRADIVRAEIGLARGQPRAALLALPSGVDAMPTLAPRIEALRARALFSTGDAIGAVRTLVRRERHLSGTRALSDNRDAIWAGLIATPLPNDADRRIPLEDGITRGWLEIALQLQQGKSEFTAWRQRYPDHPAMPRLADIRDAVPAKTYSPGPIPVPAPTAIVPTPAAAPLAMAAPTPLGQASFPVPALVPSIPSVQVASADVSLWPVPAAPATGRYALLLPHAGPLASAGEAVRDGFVSSALASRGEQVTVRLYDSGSTPASAVAAYQAAVADGASLIVGPLTKNAVSALAGLGSLPVPVLALNYLESGTVPPQLVQFGLAPEDEARAVAAQAWADGRRQMAALVPQTDWGQRVLAAFEQRYIELGGKLVDAARHSGTADLSKPLRTLLGLELSQARHKALTATLGIETEFEPRRRSDIDALFVGIRSAEASLVVPQLRFHRADTLPLYAPASIFERGAASELEGVRFCDMPWILDMTLSTEAQELFPDTLRRQPRLFALGRDAFAVADQLHRNGTLTAYDGVTGRLRPLQGGRLGRELGCAELRGGTVQTLGMP